MNFQNLITTTVKIPQSSSAIQSSFESKTRLVPTEFENVTSAALKLINGNVNFIYLQILNSFYLDITKNWICRVSTIKGVLKQTLFVATDLLSFQTLNSFKSELQTAEIYSVVYQPAHQKSLELIYGQKKWVGSI